MHENWVEDDSDNVVRGEKKRHNGAFTCIKAGRVISQLTTGGDLNLRGVSSKADTTVSTLRTRIWVVLAGGAAGEAELGRPVVVVLALTVGGVRLECSVVVVLAGGVG